MKLNIGNKEKWISVGLNLVIKVYIALCIVVRYIHGKQVMYLYWHLYAVKLKCIYFKHTVMKDEGE